MPLRIIFLIPVRRRSWNGSPWCSLSPPHDSHFVSVIISWHSLPTNLPRPATTHAVHQAPLKSLIGSPSSRVKMKSSEPFPTVQARISWWWSGFLREHNLPSATADRLVGRRPRSLIPDANRLSEPVSEPTEEEVQRLFVAVWPKLRRTLRSQQSVLLFVDLLTSHCEHPELTCTRLRLSCPLRRRLIRHLQTGIHWSNPNPTSLRLRNQIKE
jgi:hypothetical protein